MTRLTFHLIPHTHWDREWYLPHGALLARFVPVMDELLERLDAGDPPTFLLDGQTVLVEDYLTVRPDRRERVADLVREGRLQIGPWYVLADEHVPSGEALIRNLLLGAHDAAGLGGGLAALYSPDAFGHPPALPTLARQFGLEVGALWRGYDGAASGGRDLVRWMGPDGAELTIYHLPQAGYEVGGALPADSTSLRRAWPPIREGLVRRAAGPHVAVFVGADHHRVHPAPTALRNALEALEPDHEVRLSGLAEFLASAVADAGEVPTVSGELRWSYGYTWTLQGVHATRAHQKRRNGDLELLLERVAEPLAALARATGGVDRRPLLEHAWRTLVRNQFHDTLGGCCSDEVARAADARAVRVAGLGREIARSAWDELVAHDPDRARDRPEEASAALWLWNPVPRQRRSVVVADLTFFLEDVPVGPPNGRAPGRGHGVPPFTLRAPDGSPVPLQVLHRRRDGERVDASRHYPDYDAVEVVRVALEAPAMDGFAMARLGLGGPDAEPVASATTSAPVSRDGKHGLTTDQVHVRLARDGSLTLRSLESGEAMAGLLRLESEGDRGDTYTFCPSTPARLRRSTGPAALRVLAPGPLVGALEAEWDLPAGESPRGAGWGRVAARLRVKVHRGSPIVRCVLAVDNRACAHRLRLRLPLGLRGVAAVAGTAFGRVMRPARRTEPPDATRYPGETPVATAPAHRFVAAALGRRGLAVLAPGFFEYEWTEDGDLLVTVLRSVGELSRADLATRPGHAGWPTPTPEAQCLGADRMLLGLVPITEAQLARPGLLERLWEDVTTPPHARWVRASTGHPPADLGLRLEGDGLVHSACKPADDGDGIVLRCYNAGATAVDGRWRLGRPVTAAWRVRADEAERRPLVLGSGGRSVDFEAAGHELVSILVTGASRRVPAATAGD